MSELQHARIAELCSELHLAAVPDLYPVTAQAAVARDASFSDFLEDTLKGERVLRDNQDAMSASIRMRLRGWILG